MDSKAFVLQLLNRSISEKGQIKDGKLIIPSLKMTIRPEIKSLKGNGKTTIAKLHFYVSHRDFEEDFFDSTSSLSHTVPGALTAAVNEFARGGYTKVRACIKDATEGSIEADFAGKRHLFHLYGINDKSVTEARLNMWDVIKDDVKNYLGNKKVYFIKTYCHVEKDGKTLAQVRINDVLVGELSDKLLEVVKNIDCEEKLYSDLQTFIAKQDNKTYTPYPHTWQEVEAATITAVELLQKCIDEKRYEEYEDLLVDAIEDPMLVEEIYAFMPEMCAESCYHKSKYKDYITVSYDDGRAVQVYKSQITAYSWIEKALIKGFANKKFNDGTYKALVAISSIYDVIKKLDEKKQNIEDAVITYTISVDDNYCIR